MACHTPEQTKIKKQTMNPLPPSRVSVFKILLSPVSKDKLRKANTYVRS